MEITLEKIDQIIDRKGVSYKEAKEALEQSGGDVVEAIIKIEEKQDVKWTDSFSGMGNDVVETLKEFVKKGNITKIILKRDGEVVMNIPVTAGAVGAFLAPQIALFGTGAALLANCRIEIVKTDGEVVDLNDLAGETLKNMKNMAEEKFETVNKYTSKQDTAPIKQEEEKVDLNKDEAE